MNLRPGIRDNQGQAVCHAINVMGFDTVSKVRIGRIIDIDLEAESYEEAKASVKEMCKKQLVNLIMETYEIEFIAWHTYDLW